MVQHCLKLAHDLIQHLQQYYGGCLLIAMLDQGVTTMLCMI
jgi:hypothetical protein